MQFRAISMIGTPLHLHPKFSTVAKQFDYMVTWVEKLEKIDER